MATRPETTFADILGLETAKNALKNSTVYRFNHPSAYRNAKPANVLLFGVISQWLIVIWTHLYFVVLLFCSQWALGKAC